MLHRESCFTYLRTHLEDATEAEFTKARQAFMQLDANMCAMAAGSQTLQPDKQSKTARVEYKQFPNMREKGASIAGASSTPTTMGGS